ncbi:unnamed protein product [Meloidogyne enterolobii]|uniref:Uncharacterized protein n=1 Tax=Meloidogyne enterolobii TaxID=390850 RepID=A0ACB0ZH86_MELEN
MTGRQTKIRKDAKNEKGGINSLLIKKGLLTYFYLFRYFWYSFPPFPFQFSHSGLIQQNLLLNPLLPSFSLQNNKQIRKEGNPLPEKNEKKKISSHLKINRVNP